MTLEKCLKDLAEDAKPLSHSALNQLSSLSSEEVAKFSAAWASLSKSRKHGLLTKLAELCEDNLELDFSAVFRACLGDGAAEVREQATRGLWECDDRAIIRPLVELLRGDESPKVRAAAASSLGKFAGMAREGKLLARDADKVRTTLLSTIGNQREDVEVRRRAIEAVACFNSSQVQQVISEAYQSADPRMKQSAIYAMGRSSDTKWLPIVLEEMRHQEPAIRYEAASACGLLGDESTVPHLIRLINDDDAQVQTSAVHALGAIGGPLAKRALLQCLKLGDEALEEAAQAVLNNAGVEEDPPGLSIPYQGS